MKKIILIALSMALLLTSSPAFAKKKKAEAVPLNASIQEAHAATLEDGSETEKPKKKKATKKGKKSKKTKISSSDN